MKFKSIKVSAVADPILGGTPKRSESRYWGGDIKWASAKDVAQTSSRYITETLETITEEGVKHSAAKVLPKDTIVITARGTVGEMRLLGQPMAFNQSCYGLVSKDNIDNMYLFYALKYITDSIKSASYGTVFDTITKKTFDLLEIPYPSYEEQIKISSILDSLDRKIELNQKMNTTLEEMAMTLYKHWFVENEDLERVSIEEFGSIIGGGTPKTTVAEYWDGNIPWISVKDLNSAVIIETEKKITEAGLNNSSTKLLPPFSTVLSARGTIGNISIIGKEMTMNQSCYAIKAKDELDCFVFLTLKSSINTLISQSHGSVFNTITKDTLKSLELPFNKDFAIKFEKKVKPMFLQILSNTLENKELQDIRDYLLPRLLSGEIDLSKAEKQVEKVL